MHIGRRGELVVLWFDSQTIGLTAEGAKQLYLAMRRVMEKPDCVTDSVGDMRVIDGDESLVLEWQGNVVVRIPHDYVRQVQLAIRQKAGEIEEQQNAEQIAADQALFLRSPIQVPVTNRIDIQNEAWKLAENLETRWQPTVKLGKTKIIQHPPRSR